MATVWAELKRRNVVKVAATYAVVAWMLVEVASIVLPTFEAPNWIMQTLILLVVLGLPLVMIFAWAFELTPEGIRKEADVDRNQSITPRTGRKLDFTIIAVLAITVVLLLGKAWNREGSRPQDKESAQEASIAVLPFENRSAAAENAEFFAAGVHDELLTVLSRLGNLKVISRTSVERLDQNLSIPEIGALLGVATVLEGQVQRAGNRLRMNVQLINATEEDHVWATTYDRELTASNIFDVQSDIARTIAGELHVQLSANDDAVLDVVPTNNMQALQHYMLARQLNSRNSYDSLQQAARYLAQAVELDADYAEAWILIANVHRSMYQTGQIDLHEYAAAAGQAIARAMEINDRLPEAHAELASLRWQSGHIDLAEASYKSALELGPASSQTLLSYGNYLRNTGRPLEAIPVLEAALQGDPLSVIILFELGKAEMYSGRPEQFTVRAAKILEIDPSSVNGYTANLQAYLWMGRYDRTWPWFIKSMESDPADVELWAHLALYSDIVGAPEWVDRYMGRALELGPNEPAVLKCYVIVLAARGQQAAALEIARGALEADLDYRWGSDLYFLRLVRDDALQSGNYDDALSWYRARNPGLFEAPPKITVDNVSIAADLAFLQQRSGASDNASVLIDAGLAWLQRTQPAGMHGYLTNIVDVELLALAGNRDAALSALQQAVDGGWRFDWPYTLRNKTLDSLRSEPEFEAITLQLENDMSEQLDAIRALPYMGEFDLRSAISN